MDGRRPTIASLHGMVAAAHPLAAQAGAKLLAAGGNAFDAAVATAAALAVVEPHLSSLAGAGMATCYVAAEKRVRCLDFSTRVPAKFPAGQFTRREELYRGAMAIGTPGSLAGWCELAKTHGRRKLSELFAPAVALARDGFLPAGAIAAGLARELDELRRLPFFADWQAAYQPGGSSEGVLRQPELARSFEILASEGPDHFYRGALARQVVAHVQALGGCLTMPDLAAVAPAWHDPAVAAYRGLQVHTPPPPGEGFQFLLTLSILDGFELKAMERNGPDHLDAVWRAIRLAAGLRIAQNKPGLTALGRILSDGLVSPLRARMLRDRRPVEALTEQWTRQDGTPAGGHAAREHATSLAVIDHEGNAVVITQGFGGAFGSGVVVPGTGICLNNSLYWGDLDPAATNPLTPGADLALPMAPAIATRDDRPVLLLAAPGSYGISQSQAQVLVQHVDFRLPVQDAIEAPRARLWDGRRVEAESRIARTTLEALRGRGHEVEGGAAWSPVTGGVQAIAIDRMRDPASRDEAGSGVATGGADPRREGYVAVP